LVSTPTLKLGNLKLVVSWQSHGNWSVIASTLPNKTINNCFVRGKEAISNKNFPVIASVSEAIFVKSKQYFYEITSVVALPRN